MEQKTKKVKVTFYVTGQDDKSNAVVTPKLFDTVWKNHFLPQVKARSQDANFLRKGIFNKGSKDLVIFLDRYESNANEPYYFGYVGVLRDTTLPTIYNKTTSTDTNIVLSESDEILEKSYFLYYPTLDLLVFHQNHLGPRADDLSFMLYQLTQLNSIQFESIWRDQDLKSMLEDGSVLKKATITIALPRSFKGTNIDLSNSWSNSTVKMMSDSGMNRLTLQFWGKASTRKGKAGYISEVVKSGVRELINKCSGSSVRQGYPIVKKAEVQLKDHKPESLLSQELSIKVDVVVVNGYPEPSVMAQSLVYAKIRCDNLLKPYLLTHKVSA
ncbi:hypothetical protein OC503_04520 [Vibrio vulnificus]|nr:hypothetical protein [Vibrio vulnificus]MCU8362370.1 hypothetical protein [Vibrio vulnificus]MCU8366542.1 hypothetical protein [Vibrio vulnificus]HAS6166742.1 hypothetical protein [Vibrio vulnificus]HAU8260756.1 hypothetical protein [Vibrio vulnificus]